MTAYERSCFNQSELLDNGNNDDDGDANARTYDIMLTCYRAVNFLY
jgi:hypothetical protein